LRSIRNLPGVQQGKTPPAFLFKEVVVFNPYMEAILKAQKITTDASLWSRPPWLRANEIYVPYNRREELVQAYAWSIPNEEAIQALVRYSPIVDMGAGTGYWSWLVNREGGSSLPYDAGFRNRNLYNAPDRMFLPVQHGYGGVMRRHGDKTLFLSWPPLNSNMALVAARAYTNAGGRLIVYVGEGAGGCTANDAFFDYLEINYQEVERIRIPQFYGIRDGMTLFNRRGGA
jgi:hypothetical protein